MVDNPDVYNKLQMDPTQYDVSDKYSRLIQAGLPVLIMVGEFDLSCGPRGNLELIKNFQFNEKDDFFTQPRKFYYTDAENTKIQAYWRSAGMFNFLTVPKNGHYPPMNTLALTTSAVGDIIDNQALQCH